MKLYYYEHCPYCVRVRMIIGWKGLKVTGEILANADEARHYEIIGAKVVPILQKDDGSHMKESLEIIKYIEENYGQPLLRPGLSPELKLWLEKSAEPIRHLVHPRNIRIFTQDFPTKKDRDYYEGKKSKRIGSFAAALANSPKYIAAVATLLAELKSLLQVDAPPSDADIFLFPVLRSLSHVKDLLFPLQLNSYMQRLSRETGISLLFAQAI